MEQTEYDYALSFQEVMQAGKDRARSQLERLAYTGATVIEHRGPLRRLLTVADLCAMTGLDPSRIKALCSQRRFRGARRGNGRGTPWNVPGELQRDGRYKPTLYRARKGPPLDAGLENACLIVLARGQVVPF